MKFLNTKEQVLDIQLTQHGKKLLSKGVFKPEFYAFFDDDVLYDSNWAGFVEDQSEAENRILNQTPRLATQYNFSNVEHTKEIKTYWHEQEGIQEGMSSGTGGGTLSKGMGLAGMSTMEELEKVEVKDEYTQLNTLEMDRDFRIRPIGNSKIDSRYAPAWNIFYLNGGDFDTSSVTTYTTGSTSGTIENIPQLKADVDIEVIVREFDPPDQNPAAQNNMEDNFTSLTEHGNALDDGSIRSEVFSDGTMLFVEDNYILLEIKEKNTKFLKDNFDIEVFKVNSTGLSDDDYELEKLYFDIEPDNIKNDILLDDGGNIKRNVLTPNYIEYFFDILVDEEISPEAYCAAKNKDDREDPYDVELFCCPDIGAPGPEVPNIYDIPSDSNEETC